MRALLPALLVGGLLAGCGKQPDEPPATPAPALDPAALVSGKVAEREAAFARFRELSTPDALTAVLSALHHEPDDRLMRQVRAWLLAVPPGQLELALPFLLASKHYQVRVMLAAALAGRKAPALRQALLRLCADEQAAVRRQAAVSLGERAPASLLEDRQADVRLRVAEALGRSADGEADWRVQLAATARGSRVAAEGLPALFGKRATLPSAVVERAVRWLVRHQEADGRWSGWAHNRRGVGGLPGISHELAYADPSLTGLAVLALLHSGAAPGEGWAGKALLRGVRFLRRLQRGSGMIGYSTRQEAHIRASLEGESPAPKQLVLLFNHAIATWALVEAAATTRDTDIEISAGRALLALNKVRHDRYPWSRWLDPGDDVAYAGYTVLALVVARGASGLPVEPALLDGVQGYMRKVTQAATGRLHHGGKRAFCFGGYDSAATGLFIRLATPVAIPGADAKATALLLSREPRWSGRFPEPPTLEEMANDPGPITNYHYWHFGALALARLGQAARTASWMRRLVGVLETHQRRAPWVEGGSWDPCGPWSRVGGRVYATASALMALRAPVAYDWSAAKEK